MGLRDKETKTLGQKGNLYCQRYWERKEDVLKEVERKKALM